MAIQHHCALWEGWSQIPRPGCVDELLLARTCLCQQWSVKPHFLWFLWHSFLMTWASISLWDANKMAEETLGTANGAETSSEYWVFSTTQQLVVLQGSLLCWLYCKVYPGTRDVNSLSQVTLLNNGNLLHWTAELFLQSTVPCLPHLGEKVLQQLLSMQVSLHHSPVGRPTWRVLHSTSPHAQPWRLSTNTGKTGKP